MKKTTTDLAQTILDNIPDQAWLKDRESRYIAVNEAFARDCGVRKSDIAGLTPPDVWPESWGHKYLRTDRRVIESGQRWRYEETRYGADGRQLWFDTIKTPIRDARGAIVGTAGISRDITDRKMAEAALTRITRLYALRSGVNHAIAHASGVDTLLERTCRIVVEAGGFDLAWVARPALTRTGGGPGLEMTACHCDDPRWRKTLRRQLRANGSAHAECLQPAKRGLQIVEPPAASDDPHARWYQTRGLQGYASLPFHKAGRFAGVLFLYVREHGVFQGEVVQMLRELAQDISHALDALAEYDRRIQAESELRKLSAFLQKVREEERTRISRELHDELGQSLTAIQIGLGFLAARPDLGAMARLRQINTLHRIADATVGTVQRIASELRPPILDGLGLIPAIEWLIDSLSQDGEPAIRFQTNSLRPRLDSAVSTALFRIIQEALTNAHRHAHAHEIVLKLSIAQGQARLSITDDGCGIDLSRPADHPMLGLIGMRERASNLGGTFDIDASPGGGTRIKVCLPARRPE